MRTQKPRRKSLLGRKIEQIETDFPSSIFAMPFAGLGVILTAEFNLHLSLHVISILLASLIAVVSWRSYFRDPREKIGLLAIAFLLLDIHQVLELASSLGIANVNLTIPLLGIELIHAVSFSTVAFLAAGILKK